MLHNSTALQHACMQGAHGLVLFTRRTHPAMPFVPDPATHPPNQHCSASVPANPGYGETSWASEWNQDFIADHRPAAVDFAAVHIWPDLWKVNMLAGMWRAGAEHAVMCCAALRVEGSCVPCWGRRGPACCRTDF